MMEFRHKEEDLARLDRVIILTGPTAVGKTALSLHLAEELGGEIVGADSLQVYRYLDIGTAKVTREERERVRHHVIDVADPDEDFNAGDYEEEARRAIEDILGRGKVPILVGGTGLYLRLLVHGMVDLPPSNEEIRARHQEIVKREGLGVLYEALSKVDPVHAAKIHENDLIRISRGLEVFEQTGKPLSVHQEEHRFRTPNYHALKIALIRPRAELYERVNLRVKEMFSSGFRQEYEGLIERGYERELKPMQSVGYKEMGEVVFDGKEVDEAIGEVQQRTRRYAKQQISWFRGEPNVHWAMAPIMVEGELPGEVLREIEEFLGGESPSLEWAGVDPYNVRRQ